MSILTTSSSNVWTAVDRNRQQVAVAVGATTAVFVAAYALRSLIGSSKRAGPVLKEIPTPKQSYPYVGKHKQPLPRVAVLSTTLHKKATYYRWDRCLDTN